MQDKDPQVEKLKALTILWAEAHPKVAGFVGAFIHDYNDAQDVVQEVARAAVEAIDTYELDRPFGPWILGVARFKVLDCLRKRGRDRHIFDSDSVERLADVYIREDHRLDDMKAALAQCMNLLGDRDRRALSLRYVDDIKPAKVADLMGIKPSAARVMLHRIRLALAQCVERKLTEGQP